VSDETIKKFCENTPGKLIVVTDACHPGRLNLTGIVQNLALDLSRNDYGVIAIAGSRGDQYSWELDRLGSGA